jgi:hypothetical protein
LSARLQCSQFLHNWGNIEPLYGRGGGERGIDRAQTISLNCGVTHSRGKIEFNCRYFLMTFRTQIHKKKFGKNGFHTLQSTMSHRPLTNISSLKITAAYTVKRPKSKSSLMRQIAPLEYINTLLKRSIPKKPR